MSHPSPVPAPSGSGNRSEPDVIGIPTFVIGLPDRYRGAPLEAQLRDQGVTFERSDGVIVDRRSADVVDDGVARIFARRGLTNGEIGAALAHRRVYQRMLDEGHPIALVFEDDARLRGKLDLRLVRTILSTSRPTVLLLSHRSTTAIAVRRDYEMADQLGGVVRTIFPPTGATAYALNAAAALLLLEGGRPVSSVPDWPVRPAPFIDFRTVMDSVAEPAPEAESVIGARTPTRRASRLRRYVRLLLTATHIRWLVHARHYGSYRAYVQHELVRMRAIRRGDRIVARRGPDEPAWPVKASVVDDALARLWIRRTP